VVFRKKQLIANIGAVGWNLSASQMAALNEASNEQPTYPVWHQREIPRLYEKSPY
jgi:diketogulonate reductase-like aldo/keto reductase